MILEGGPNKLQTFLCEESLKLLTLPMSELEIVPSLSESKESNTMRNASSTWPPSVSVAMNTTNRESRSTSFMLIIFNIIFSAESLLATE